MIEYLVDGLVAAWLTAVLHMMYYFSRYLRGWFDWHQLRKLSDPAWYMCGKRMIHHHDTDNHSPKSEWDWVDEKFKPRME